MVICDLVMLGGKGGKDGTLTKSYGQGRAAQTFTSWNVELTADRSGKRHWELSSRPVGRDLNWDNVSCLHQFPAGLIEATHGAQTMLAPSC